MKKAPKPYKGEIANWRKVHYNLPGTSYRRDIYGPNLGYLIQGDFQDHPIFRGINALGGTTSLVVKHDADGNIETLNTRYKLVGDEEFD